MRVDVCRVQGIITAALAVFALTALLATPSAYAFYTPPPNSNGTYTGPSGCGAPSCIVNPGGLVNGTGSQTGGGGGSGGGGGGGSGGGGGGAYGGSYSNYNSSYIYTPQPIPTTFCVQGVGIAEGKSYTWSEYNVTARFVDNMIGNGFYNISLNGNSYVLHSTNETESFSSKNVLVTANVTSIVSNTMDVQLCFIQQTAKQATTISNTPPPLPAPPKIAAPQSTQSQGVGTNLPTLGGFLVAGAGFSKIRRRLSRGRKKHALQLQPGALKLIEEAGVIEIIAAAAAVLFFVYNYFLLSVIVAFGFGITMTYLVDRVRSKDSTEEYSYERKEGIRRVLEELGVFEIVVLAATVWLFIMGYMIFAVALAAVFGVLFTYFVDRVRNIRDIVQEFGLSVQQNQPAAASQYVAAEEKEQGKDGKDENDAQPKLPDAAYTPPPEIGAPLQPPTHAPKKMRKSGAKKKKEKDAKQ
jgi:hypothetical protein